MSTVLTISKLKLRAIKLGEWKGPTRPPRTQNLTRAIVNFARFMGIPSIPAQTVKKLADDPYFPYCFSILTIPDFLFENDGTSGTPEISFRLCQLLQAPGKAKNKDLFQGLTSFFNNFSGYMPNGPYRIQYASMHTLTDMSSLENIFILVDNYLNQKGLMKEAVDLKKAFDCEKLSRYTSKPRYAKSVKYFILCLKVFEHLVAEQGLEPDKLRM